MVGKTKQEAPTVFAVMRHDADSTGSKKSSRKFSLSSSFGSVQMDAADNSCSDDDDDDLFVSLEPCMYLRVGLRVRPEEGSADA